MSARILLIEDEPGIQLAIRGLLRRDGYQVFIESRGSEALHAVETGSYDLILTDLSLEDGVSGLDIARRAREACPETPVVLITAYGSEQIEVQAREAGVWDYVPKPFDNQIVRDVVRRAIETGRG
jgi:two-component system response regulator PilR (NtrC family)